MLINQCDNCPSNSCAEVLDAACGIYHSLHPETPTKLIYLDLPNGSSLQTIFEKIDQLLDTSGNGPLTETDTNSIAIKLSGVGNRNLQMDLILSEASGNTAVVKNDGLYVPVPDNLYKVQVDSKHIPYYLDDVILGGSDGMVNLTFKDTNGILIGVLSIKIEAVVTNILNNSTLVNELSSDILNAIVNNSTLLKSLTDAIKNAILNDSHFITNLVQAIINNGPGFDELCDKLKGCLPGHGSGSTECMSPIATSSNSILAASGGTVSLFVNYTDATPLPSVGYLVFYRVAGSSGAYSTAGPFATGSSPAVVNNLTPNNYEGYIESSCGDGLFSSGSTFATSDYFNTSVTNALPDITITSIANIPGFALTSPLATGQSHSGIQGGFTGAIQVNATGTSPVNGHLSLTVNGSLIQCINVPAGTSVASESFNSHTFAAGDSIQILYVTGTC